MSVNPLTSLFNNHVLHIHLHDDDDDDDKLKDASTTMNTKSIDQQITSMLTKKESMWELNVHGVPNASSKLSLKFEYLLNQLLTRVVLHDFELWKDISFKDFNFEIDLKLAELIVDVTKQVTEKCHKLSFVSFEQIEFSHDACCFLFTSLPKVLGKSTVIKFRSCKWNDLFIAGIQVLSFSFHNTLGRGIVMKTSNCKFTINGTRNFWKECNHNLMDKYETKLGAIKFFECKNMSLETLEQLFDSFLSEPKHLGENPCNRESLNITNLFEIQIIKSTLYSENNNEIIIDFPGKLVVQPNTHKYFLYDATFDVQTSKITQLISKTFHFGFYAFENCSITMESLKHFFHEKPAVGGSNVIQFQNCTFTSSSSSTTFPKVTEMEWENDGNKSFVRLEDETLTSETQDSIISVMKLIINDYFPLESVTELSLSENLIENSGMQHIAKYLNQTLITSLNLDDTGLDDSHIFDLCETLKSNTSLKSLNISRNDNITRTGLKKILQVLQIDNMTLLDVILVVDEEEEDDDDSSTNSKEHRNNSIAKEIRYYLQLNQMGRCHLLKFYQQNLPTTLVALVLVKGSDNPSCLYWFLQQFPHYIFLISDSCQQVGHKRARTTLRLC